MAKMRLRCDETVRRIAQKENQRERDMEKRVIEGRKK